VANLTFQTRQVNIDTFRGFEAATAVTVLYMITDEFLITAMNCEALATFPAAP
jgi:ABC-type arginine/histidine transport system permease subunit